MEDLNAINYFELVDIYRTLYPTIAEYIFSSSEYSIFAKINHMVGHKMNLLFL